MSVYHYQALNKEGKLNKGIIEADSERQARQILRERDLTPMHLQSPASMRFLKKKRITKADLTLLTRQLASLIGAGIPLEEALRGVSEQTEKASVRELIIAVKARVIEGYALAKALEDYPRDFPELYCATIAAGEQTGRLDLVLEKLADYTEHQQAILQKIQQALIYPSAMIIISTGIIGFLMTFVVPKIIEVFNSTKQTLPVMTQVLIALSKFIQAKGLLSAFLLFLMLLIFKKGLKQPKLQSYWHNLLLHLPLVSRLSKLINAARYIHSFGILFAAGVNILETMRIAASLVSNLAMRPAFIHASTRVREGSAIHLALRETGFLSPLATHLIASGEKSGQISSMMARTAFQIDAEVKRFIDTGLTLFEPLVILCMGTLVLFIVLATLLPIFSMQNLVN